MQRARRQAQAQPTKHSCRLPLLRPGRRTQTRRRNETQRKILDTAITNQPDTNRVPGHDSIIAI